MKRLFYVTLVLLVLVIGYLTFREMTRDRWQKSDQVRAPGAPGLAEQVTPESRVPEEQTPAAEGTRAPEVAEATTPAPREPSRPPAMIRADFDSLLQGAASAAAAGDKERARQAYIKLLQSGYSGPQLDTVKDKLGALNDEILFSPQPCRESIVYTVQPSDRKGLSAIAKRLDTTYPLIMRINGKKNTMIRVGERLKVIPSPFDVLVKKKDFVLDVYLKGSFVKRYRVGLGNGGSTPAGEFKVINKLVKPSWYRPGGEVPYGSPENPLGTRWIGFSGAYGIHGTWEPGSIGKRYSRGCVRMLNADVEELYDLLVVGKSKVTVEP